MNTRKTNDVVILEPELQAGDIQVGHVGPITRHFVLPLRYGQPDTLPLIHTSSWTSFDLLAHCAARGGSSKLANRETSASPPFAI